MSIGGKVKISSQFLQSASSNNTRVESKAYSPASNGGLVNKTASAFNNNNNNTGKANGTNGTNGTSHFKTIQTESAITPAITESAITPAITEPPHAPPAPAAAPTTTPLAYAPPALLQHLNNDDDDEEVDEWADNSEIKIVPTIAPLATYDEETPSLSPSKHHESTNEQANYASQHQYQNYPPSTENENSDGYANKPDATPSSNGKLTAVALYDYQAADSDEISFDPSDIITDIVQVSFSL